MHPGFFGWWKGRGPHSGRGEGCGPEDCSDRAGDCSGPRGGRWGRHGHHEFFAGHGGHHEPDEGGFGVRRPLRFLAWKLELEEAQFGKLASILDELKTERAQAAVDQRRTIAGFAEAIASGNFDEAKAKEAGDLRIKSAERVRDAVVKALASLHALLDQEQRDKLAYLLRTGALTI
ncbi:MAG: Spy/CpxP family protein refolding chaperone [Polyangiaceae bacterium]